MTIIPFGCGKNDANHSEGWPAPKSLADAARIRQEMATAHLKHMPPRLSIDELGWTEFLRRWAAESTELYRTIVFQYGFDGGRWLNETQKQDEEDFIRSMEADFGVPVPRELFFGGVAYPPQNDADKQRVEQVLRQAKAVVDAANAKRKAGEVQEWGPRDYNGMPDIMFNAFNWAAFMGEQMYPPATEADISAAETRLGVRLPASYKAFLRVSNGFWVGKYTCLMPVNKIGKLQELDEFFGEWISDSPPEDDPSICASADYYRYGEDGLTGEHSERDRALESCGQKLGKALLLSDDRNTDGSDIQVGIVPFEPSVDVPGKPEDEWEAFWHFAPRALSFKHLMEYLYRYHIAKAREFLSRQGHYPIRI